MTDQLPDTSQKAAREAAELMRTTGMCLRQVIEQCGEQLDTLELDALHDAKEVLDERLAQHTDDD